MFNHFKMLLLLLMLICSHIKVSASSGSNLNIVILGDSNTSIGGDDCSDPQGWTKWFVDRIGPKSCRSYARSGATWTNTSRTRYDVEENTQVLSDDNVIYNQMNRLIKAYDDSLQAFPDVIIIAAGTNDAWFENKRPGIFSTTVDQVFQNHTFDAPHKISSVVSLAGSVRLVCEHLMSRFPETRIILLSPMQTTKASYKKTDMVGSVLEECAHRMSVPIVRQDRLNGVYSAREANHKYMTVDGTHTSVEGARRNGYLIANQFAALLCY